MKRSGHFQFIFTTSLLVVVTTLIVTYIIAALLLYRGLSDGTFILMYFLQFLMLVIFSKIFLKNLSKEYFAQLKSINKKTFSTLLFAIIYSAMIILVLFTIDWICSLVIGYSLSGAYGSYLDHMLAADFNKSINNENSFTILPITLQNIVLNILGSVVIFFIAKKQYRKDMDGLIAETTDKN